MPRRKRHPVNTDLIADPANALQALIAKYRQYPDLAELDISDINQQTFPNDDALLHYVARYGGPDEVSLLAACGANVNLPGDIGYTPLHYAAGWGMLDNVVRLLELGADTHIKDEFGATAMIITQVSTEIYPERKTIYAKIAKLLRQAG